MSLCAHGSPCHQKQKIAYQIRERVQLLSHETGLLPPPCDLAVHEVEEQSEWDEAECEVEVRVVVGVVLYAVAQRGKDGHDTAEAYASCQRVDMQCLNFRSSAYH